MDYRQQLAQRLESIEAGCRNYDSGNVNEATQLAVQMRAVFHDTSQAPSLLAHLKSHFIDLLSTTAKRPGNIPGGYWTGLLLWELDPTHLLYAPRPRLNTGKAAHRFVAFKFWWDSEPVYQFGDKKVKRRDLILTIANKNGEAQVDTKLPADYRAVIDSLAWKITIKPDPSKPSREIIIPFAYQAAIRQIAHEILHSPALLKLAGR